MIAPISSATESSATSMDSLLAERERLLARRAELQERLASPVPGMPSARTGKDAQQALIRDLVLKTKPERLPTATSGDLDYLLRRVCVRARKTQLLQQLSAYRLLGISFSQLSPSSLLVCFNPFYEGRYLGQFFVELQLEQGKLSVTRHTLPHVVPVVQLSRKFLRNGNAKLFCLDVRKYLDAAAGRQCEVSKIRSRFSRWLVDGSLKTTLSVVYVKLRLNVRNGKQLEVVVVYDALQNVIPSRARVLELGEDPVSNRNARRLLKRDVLSRGVKAVLELYGCSCDPADETPAGSADER